MSETLLKVEDLEVYYGVIRALKGISFEVKKGEIVSLIGANGAGKTTTLHTITGLIHPKHGTVCYKGRDITKVPAHKIVSDGLVHVPEGRRIFQQLSVYDNLESRAALYGITGADFRKRLEELSALLDLAPLYKRAVGKLSGGQRRRIDIARALLHRPKILVLDEPTTGLDPQTRKTLWSVISDLRKNEGMTVFLTTHYMEEAADADYVVILDSGKIAAEGTPLELKNQYTGDFITLYNVELQAVQALGQPYEAIRDAYRLSVPNTAAATELIVKNPSLFLDYEITKGKMDDVFLAVTGKKPEGGMDA